ncbi:probable protein phosphatase 2C 56 isoform X2 [Triticum aestivum]|uniref:probable protein phosphatase 2C 56 isoform X2 n=1 Tax=Triticum aestivum TaxID=4565 RepID=UPI001D0196C2|nr:probable protein phosphatase 2C 56 isoform X2 [Triticum aestivum]
MARAAAANLRGLVGIAAAGRRRVTASVATPRASPGGRGFRAVASGSGGRTTPESSSSSSPALPQLQPRRGLETRRAVLRDLISGGLESEDGKLSCGYSSFKGRRPTMEDRYDVKFAKIKGQSVSLFAVFDGHAGPLAAEYLKEYLLDNLIKHPQFLRNPKLALTIPLSDDHKPNLKDERARIENAGGGVSYDGFTWRVDGILAMSRAFGNRSLKNYVIAEPDIQETQVSSDLEYLVLATDGLWDVVQNEDVISLMKATDGPEAAAVKLTEMAHSRHSSDNITCIVVQFHD